MKITIIANNSNGLYLFRRNLIGELVNKGVNVTALTPFDMDVDNLRALGAELIEVPIDRRGTNPVSDLLLLTRYIRNLKSVKPDAVISYTIKPNIYGGFACRLLIPYCANITGLGTAFDNPGLLKFLVTELNKIALKKAKVVFFENNANKELFVNSGIIKERQAHVLNGAGVDLDLFSLKKYPDSDDPTRFLFIGRIMKEKGIDELLQAVRELVEKGEKCVLDVLGSFEEDYSDIFEQYEKEGWLYYYGQQADVRPFIENSHCFVLPSYHEGMANTNLESASSGRPVITSNIPGCMEAVLDNVSGFLCKVRNADSLKDTMEKFLHLSKEKKAAMGLEGRKYMEAHFDKRAIVQETIEAIMQSLHD